MDIEQARWFCQCRHALSVRTREGQETAEIGKALNALRLLGLEVVILPRHQVPGPLRRRAKVEMGPGG